MIALLLLTAASCPEQACQSPPCAIVPHMGERNVLTSSSPRKPSRSDIETAGDRTSSCARDSWLKFFTTVSMNWSGSMNIDPVELFGEALMHAAGKGAVIAQLQQLPVSMAIKRAVYARWCDLVEVSKEEIDFRALARPVAL